eukprot:66587_1
MALQVIGGICSLIAELLSGVKSILTDPIPDVRSASALAILSLNESLGGGNENESNKDLDGISIALSAHITSLITSFNINFLMQSSSNILLYTTYITIFGIVIFTILSMILKKDKDEKWFLSPITVYDIKQNKFEKHFCKRQIMLLADIKHNKSIKTNNNIPYVHTISDDDEKEYDEEDRVYLQLQRRQLRVEMDAFIKNKPKLMRNNKFNKIYLLLILSMCFLSLMNCFHVFSFSILKAILPSIYYHYGDKYNLNSIKTISSMLQIGMIFALILALFYRYYSNQSIYGQYKCSAVLVKLSIAISAILSASALAILSLNESLGGGNENESNKDLDGISIKSKETLWHQGFLNSTIFERVT